MATKSKMFDLSKNDVSKLAEAGFEFELVMPGLGESTGAFVTVRGEYSPTVKEHGKKAYNEYQMQVQASKRKGKEYEISIEESKEMAVKSAVVRVISWRNVAFEGAEVPFTKEAAASILKDHTWIIDQIMEESQLAFNFRPK
jgi:hypothetical protein